MSIGPRGTTRSQILAYLQGLVDPLPVYQKESEKAAANGYPSLDGSSRVVQNPANANLLSLAGLSGVADRLAYFTGVGALALATFTGFGRSVVAAVDAAAGRTVLGAAPSSGPAYLLIGANHADLASDRQLALGPLLEGVDGGANGAYTLDFAGTVSAYDVSDDLVATLNASGWGSGGTAGGSLVQVAGVANHPGVIQIATAGLSGNTYRAYLGPSASGNLFVSSEMQRWAVLVQIPDTSTMTFSIGIGDSLGAHGLGNNAVSFEADVAVNANWRCSSKSGGVQEGPTVTTVAITSTNWYLLEVRRDAATGNLAFYINGALVATHTTQKPSAPVSLGMCLTTNTNATRNANLDWYRLRLVTYGNRYT